MVMLNAPPRPATRSAARSTALRGFSFLEILMVMAMMAVLAGLGIGFMQNMGQGTRLLQARAMVLESAQACKGSSNGRTRATFSLRQGVNEDQMPRIFVEALAARSVLTADFETADYVSLGFPVRPHGGAQVDPDASQGFNGRALRLQRGGYLELPAQASFAMTEGISIDLHVRPEGGGGSMTLLQGTDPQDERSAIYSLSLARAGQGSSYDVRLALMLRLRPDAVATGSRTEFTTTGAPVRADGTWQHIQVHYDGREASIRVNGLERIAGASSAAKAGRAAPASPTAPTTPAASDVAKRLVVPPSGTVRITISGSTTPFIGWLDALVVGGMFRSSEFSRELFPDLVVKQPNLPVRAEFVNGRLDPLVHRSPIVIVIADAAKPQSIPWTITLGLDGEITAVEGTTPQTTATPEKKEAGR
jgi:prepilin-type N-terminal cleavage/methylation domain-containing protein